MEQALKTHKSVKPVDIFEIKVAVPQSQVNTLKQMVMRYILDNNNQDIAFKLLEQTETNLREDIKIWN